MKNEATTHRIAHSQNMDTLGKRGLSCCAATLPLQGSNLDSSDPEAHAFYRGLATERARDATEARKGHTESHTVDHLRQRATVDASGCWVWAGARNDNGYGRVKIQGRKQYAHRVAYVAANGPIPPGFQIDHLCRNRACINPAHLEAVDQRTNVLRGDGSAAHKARQTHCINGHALVPGNLRNASPAGSRNRRCLTCHRNRQAERRQRLRATRPHPSPRPARGAA